MSTFRILLVVFALAVVVTACEDPTASGHGSPLSTTGGAPPDVGPPSSQPNPINVVVGPTGLHALDAVMGRVASILMA